MVMLPPWSHVVSRKRGAEGHFLVSEGRGEEGGQPSGCISEVCLVRSLRPPLLRDFRLMVVCVHRGFFCCFLGFGWGGGVEANFPADFTAQGLVSSALFSC